MIVLSRETGEKFLEALRKLCVEQDIMMSPAKIFRKKKVRKGMTKHERQMVAYDNAVRDGIWRDYNHFDGTCTNISELSDTFYRLGLEIDLTDTSAPNAVKWTWSKIKRLDGTKYTSYSLDQNSLKKKLFPKLKKILTGMDLVVDEMKCETLGGLRKTVWVQIRVSPKAKWIEYQAERKRIHEEQAIREVQMKKEQEQREKDLAILREHAAKWRNLSVINIQDFPQVHEKITKHFIVNAQHDLGIDFDMEHRGLAFNSQDPKVVGEVVHRLQAIDGIKILYVEKIVDREAA